MVIRWAELNSWSRNLEGLSSMVSLLETEFGVIGERSETIELAPQQVVGPDGLIAPVPLGKALRIRKRTDANVRVFLSAHMDTVYPPDHPLQKCTKPDDESLKGPGVADAKGGLVVMLTALEALERSPWAENLGWEVLITPDEELGSPGSAPLFAAAAKDNHIGLVFEPCFADGSLVEARKGSGNFTAVVRGRAAHAGRDPHQGRNAINATARFIVELNALQSESRGVTINVGNIRGGGPVNVVPDLAICRFNVRVGSLEAQRTFEEDLRMVTEGINKLDGISIALHGNFARPPKPFEGKTVELFRHVAQCGRDLGLTIQWRPTGGACDGNNLQAAGLPTVDSLGVRGADLHSAEEYMLLGSLIERARLAALLLMKLASGEIRLM